MANIHFKVELRKESNPVTKQWQEPWTFQTLEEAKQRIAWWQQYDEYYSPTGWEYNILEVKARKKR